MKKLLVGATVAILVPIVGLGIATAQEEEGPPNFVPVELNACSYKDGKDQDDHDRALNLMTEWMEENDSEPYAAFRLFPAYAGDPEFDFVYFGVWPDGATMGRDLRDYAASAEDAIEAWTDAVDCNSVMFASLQLRAPEGGGDGDNDFMVSVSDCNVADGRSNSDAIDAIEEWGAHRDANGSPGGIWVWYPVHGDGDAEFDFKMLASHDDVVAFGNWWKFMVDTASYNVQNELYENLLECDVARLYNGETIINTWPDDDGD